MKHSKPCQHYKRVKTKRGTKVKLINKGIKRKRRMLFKSTDFKRLSQAVKEKQKDERMKLDPFTRQTMRTPEGKAIWEKGQLDDSEVLKYVDWNKGFYELEKHGLKVPKPEQDKLLGYMQKGEFDKAYETAPRTIKIFAHGVSQTAPVIYDDMLKKRSVPTRVVRKLTAKELAKLNAEKYKDQDDLIDDYN